MMQAYVFVKAMLESLDVGFLVLRHEFHLLGEFAFSIACERVELFLSAFSHLVTTLVVTIHHRQLYRLHRLYTQSQTAQAPLW